MPLLLISLFLGFSLPFFARAETSEAVERRVQKLSAELLSPFCPGKTITNCTSHNAYLLRLEMQKMAADGMSDEEISALLKDRFKHKQIVNPKQPWYLLLLPFLPFILGGVLLFWVLYRWGGPKAQRSSSGAEHLSPLDEDENERRRRLRVLLAAEDE